MSERNHKVLYSRENDFDFTIQVLHINLLRLESAHFDRINRAIIVPQHALSKRICKEKQKREEDKII